MLIKANFPIDGSIFVAENEEFLKNGSKPVLIVESKGHALHAFVNQECQGYPLTDSNHITSCFVNQLSTRDHIRIENCRHYEIQHKLLGPMKEKGR